MAKAYLMGHITVTNPEGYKKYSQAVPATIEKHGGKYLVRAGASTQREGEPLPERHVILEFPSRQALDTWYDSPEYQAILPHRTANSVGQIVLVDGL
ncbi:MAG: hypothetical protein RLZZ192_1235 [Pseudomonadota bacterium]